MAILCQNPYDEEMPLMECLARVYLAKRAAEKDPYVSEATSLQVLVRGAPSYDLSKECLDYLREKVPPISVPVGLEFSASFLQTTKK